MKHAFTLAALVLMALLALLVVASVALTGCVVIYAPGHELPKTVEVAPGFRHIPDPMPWEGPFWRERDGTIITVDSLLKWTPTPRHIDSLNFVPDSNKRAYIRKIQARSQYDVGIIRGAALQ